MIRITLAIALLLTVFTADAGIIRGKGSFSLMRGEPIAPSFTLRATSSEIQVQPMYNADALSYDMELCIGAGSCTVASGVDGVHQFTGLLPLTEYNVKVLTNTASGSTSYSPPAFSTTSPTVSSVCTDGVDCRCDVLVSTYGADIVFCEDFENPRLTIPGVWQKNPGSLQGAGWNDQGYNNQTAGCGFCNDGATCIPQYTSLLPGTGDSQIVNVDRCIELNTRDRQSAVPSLNSTNQVFDGNVSYAGLMQPSSRWGLTWNKEDDPSINPNFTYPDTQPQYQSSGRHGQADFDRAVTNFGVTRAVMITTEIAEAQTAAWKDDQVSDDQFSLFGTSIAVVVDPNNVGDCTGIDGGMFQNMEPFASTIWRWASGVFKTWTAVEGAACVANRLQTTPLKAGYTPPTKGQWYCQQIQYEGWGTANMRVRQWLDGQLLIDIQDVDTSIDADNAPKLSRDGLDMFIFNNYWNGDGSNNANQGWTGSSFGARLKDNWVVKEGAPVSCSEIGFP